MDDRRFNGGRLRLLRMLVAGMLCAAVPFAVRAATFTASIEPDTIVLGETAVLSLTFENGQPDGLPVIPAVSNLQVNYRGARQESRWVNGQSTSSYSLDFLVMPLKVGEYTIPPIAADVGAKRLTSKPLKLRAVKTEAGAQTQASQDKVAFLRISAPKTEVFVGEPLPVEIRLYAAIGAQDLRAQPLAAEGFTLGKSVNLPQGQVRVGTTLYQSFAVKTVATPTKTGTLQLGPVEWSLDLRYPAQRRRRSADPFDGFFSDFFGSQYEIRTARLVSNSLSIQVHPMPKEDMPAAFTGAVGDFSFSLSAGPTNVAVGEPITLKMRVSGRGALDNIILPSLDGWREFKTYPPSSNVDSTDPLGLEGTKNFEQVVVPQNTEVAQVPPVSFSHFDPDRKAYRTVTSKPVPIIVRPSLSVQALPSLATNQAPGETPPRRDIVHLKARLGSVSTARPPLLHQPWFLLVQALPILTWISALSWRKRQDHLARNPRLVRRQQVSQEVRRGLAQLRKLAEQNLSEEFFALLSHLLQEQLGERLNLPAAAITEAVVDEQLRPRGAAGDILDGLHALFNACNVAKYAPAASNEELMSILQRAEIVLGQLRKTEL